MRSFLTALGIIFGIASVVSMLAIGEGAQNQILEQIQGLGLNNIIIRSQKPKEEEKQEKTGHSWVQNYGLTNQDLKILTDTVPDLKKITILKNHSGRAWNKSIKKNIVLKGVEAKFFELVKLPLQLGRRINEKDNLEFRNVCIVPAQLLKKISLPQQINQVLKVKNHYYQIIGVYNLEDLPSSLHSKDGPVVFIPFNVSLYKLGQLDVKVGQGSFQAVRQMISEIICQVSNEDRVVATSEWIDKVLKQNHPKQDYQLEIPLQLLKQKQHTQNIFNIVMVLIAAISLIVGGIGIINIMLATISERTKEIGTRRAIGARKKDIILQFLTETVILTIAAGVIGCLLGLINIQIIKSSTGWNAIIHPSLFLYAFLISCLTGILFGLYPAKKAADLNPIESLRYD